MSVKLIERLEHPQDVNCFGAVAVRGDTATMVVITEIPEEAGFPAVNVAEIDYDKQGTLLRAAGTLPLDQLWILPSEAPWPVDRIVEGIVYGEFGLDAGEDIITGFKEIFARHAERSAIAA